MKLLLATDGSKFSSAATQAVIDQFKRKGTEVRAIHVVDTMSEPFPEMTAYDAEVAHEPNPRRAPAEALVQSQAQLLRAEGLKTTTAVVWGDPRLKILEEASHWGANLIVLGSHGRTGLQRFLVGSVADAVVHHARCSVEVVRIPNQPRTGKSLKIVLAVDDSKFSDAAMNAVIAQIEPIGTALKLIQVLERFSSAKARKTSAKMRRDFAGPRTNLRDQAMQKLSKAATKLRSLGFVTSFAVEGGDPREAILDCAARWPAGLIVVGTHGRRGIKHLLLGSVSEAVNRHAACSVEVVRLPSNR